MKANSVSNATTSRPANARLSRRAVVAIAVAAAVVCAAVALVLSKDRGYPMPSRVTVTVRHIEFRAFQEDLTLAPGDEVFIHDTAFSIRLVDFMPDFTMDEKTGEVRSRSREMNNPAAKIRLMFDGELVNETWAFRDVPNVHRVLKPGFIFTVADVRMEEQP